MRGSTRNGAAADGDGLPERSEQFNMLSDALSRVANSSSGWTAAGNSRSRPETSSASREPTCIPAELGLTVVPGA